jgi:hypothetical protein
MSPPSEPSNSLVRGIIPGTKNRELVRGAFKIPIAFGRRENFALPHA